MRLRLTSLLLTLLMSMGVLGDCIEDFGTPNMFGSYEQLNHIQKEIKVNGCNFILITWNNKTFQGDKVKRMIALDVEEGIMIRTMLMPYSRPSLEFWYGFNKSTVLNDDPSDGFDLPNYTTSFDESKLSSALKKALRNFK